MFKEKLEEKISQLEQALDNEKNSIHKQNEKVESLQVTNQTIKLDNKIIIPLYLNHIETNWCLPVGKWNPKKFTQSGTGNISLISSLYFTGN